MEYAEAKKILEDIFLKKYEDDNKRYWEKHLDQVEIIKMIGYKAHYILFNEPIGNPGPTGPMFLGTEDLHQATLRLLEHKNNNII